MTTSSGLGTPRVRRTGTRCSAVSLIAVWLIASPAVAQIKVVSDFEGGSAKEVTIDQGKPLIRLAPGGDPERGWPCWWSVRIEGLRAKEPFTLEVTVPSSGLGLESAATRKKLAADWLFPTRATCSDDDKTWRHSEPGKRTGDVMAYTIRPTGTQIRVAWGPPYTPGDAAELVRFAEKVSPSAKGFELCRSNGQRPVPALHIRERAPADENRFGVWVSARQHAWECGSSWVGQGFVKWLVGDDPRAAWVRQHADVYFVPVMDVDHVAEGNGGKNGQPHDHNRGWTDEPHWAEVAAAQKVILALVEEGRMDLFLDLHNPVFRDQQPYFFVSGDDQLTAAGRQYRDRWLRAAREEIIDPFELAERTRSAGPTYDANWKQISGNWVQANANPQTVAVCLETPWNTRHSTTEGYETVGRQLGLAVERYLRTRSGAAE